MDQTVTAVLAAAAVGLFALAVLSFVLRQREINVRAALRRATADGARLRTLLEASSAEYWAFAGDAEAGSPGLARRLGLGEPPQRFMQIAAAFSASELPALSRAVEHLRQNGQPFVRRFLTGAGRTIEVEGAPCPAGAVLWFRDVSPTREELDTVRRELAVSNTERDLLRQVLDCTLVPLWRRNERLELAWCNRAYAAILESTPETAVSRRLELASAVDVAQARRLAARANELKAPQSERRHLVVEGDRRAFRVVESPLAAGGGIGWAVDVTEQERAEADLANHVEAHAEVLQNLATAIAIFGPDRRLTLFNRAFARLFRLDEEWLAQQPGYAEILEVLRETRNLPEQADWQAYKKERMALFTAVIEPREEVIHLPDGRTLRLVITPHPFGGLLLTFEDVTDQLVLERSRNTLIAVQRATLDNLYESVAVYGGDGRLKLWNTAFARIWGLDEALLAQEPHMSEVVEATRSLLDDGTDWQALKARMVAPFNERTAQNGRINRLDDIVVDYASVPLPDGAMLFSYIDVSDTVRIERALRDRNEALQAADQLKSEFIANVSYELRTPLNTIIGFAEIIANQYFGELNQRQLEYAEGILDSSHHLLLLVNDILDLATIEAGHMLLELEPFDLHATLVAILGLTRERARRQNLAIELDCPAEIGWFEADERRIKQVLFNLMSNAMKFTPPGGTITLGARRTETEVLLWVTDTGIGIPEEEQRQVFEKFHKRRAGGRQPGAGLGLSLVRSFIELHGGYVELRSIPDQGTAVTCHLPLIAAGDAALQVADADADAGGPER